MSICYCLYTLYTLMYFLKRYVQVLHFSICHKLWCISLKSLKNIMKSCLLGGGVCHSNSLLFVFVLNYRCYIGVFSVSLTSCNSGGKSGDNNGTQAMLYSTVILSVWAIIQIGIYLYISLMFTPGSRFIIRRT